MLDEGVAEFMGTARESRDDAALIPAPVVILAAVDVFGAEPAHAVDESGERVGSGGDGLGDAEPGFQSAGEGSEGGRAVREI